MGVLTSILVAVSFNLIDIVTGLVSALKEKKLVSSKLRDGLFKKCGFFVCYVIFFIIDKYGVLVGFNLEFNTLPLILAYSVTTEIVSIFENVNKLNSDILPEKLKSFLDLNKE